MLAAMTSFQVGMFSTAIIVVIFFIAFRISAAVFERQLINTLAQVQYLMDVGYDPINKRLLKVEALTIKECLAPPSNSTFDSALTKEDPLIDEITPNEED